MTHALAGVGKKKNYKKLRDEIIIDKVNEIFRSKIQQGCQNMKKETEKQVVKTYHLDYPTEFAY